MKIHESQLKLQEKMEVKGWVPVEKRDGWVQWVDPTKTCLHTMRDGLCLMDLGHRGRHTTVVFYCDSCGKTRRGSPYRSNEDADFCFMCLEAPYAGYKRGWE